MWYMNFLQMLTNLYRHFPLKGDPLLQLIFLQVNSNIQVSLKSAVNKVVCKSEVICKKPPVTINSSNRKTSVKVPQYL